MEHCSYKTTTKYSFVSSQPHKASALPCPSRFVQNPLNWQFEIRFGWMNHFVILSKMAKTDNLGIFVPLGDP